MARQHEGRLDEAATHYRRALEIEPGSSAALTNLGNVLRRQGRAAEAESRYREAIERDPRATEPWINLGNLTVDRGDFPEAERCYRKALTLAPGDRAARYNLAKALEGQQRIAEAIAEYETLTREHPEVAQFFNDLGAARILAGEPEAAELDLRRAIGLRRDWEVPWYNLGLALEARGRVEEARAAFHAAQEIAPGWTPPLERLRALRAGRKAADRVTGHRSSRPARMSSDGGSDESPPPEAVTGTARAGAPAVCAPPSTPRPAP
jgi:Flp pilus assembly protein TadD